MNVDPEEARERVGLGVTELRELGCHVLHRAMPLAQPHTCRTGALPDRSDRRGETVGGQCRRQQRRSGGDILARLVELSCIPLFKVSAAFASERAHGIGACVFGKEPQRRGGHLVIVAVHPGMTDLGQNVGPGRPAAPATSGTSQLAHLDGALLGKEVEVTADRGGRQAQTRGEGGRGERAMLRKRLPDPVTSPHAEAVRPVGGRVLTIGNESASD